MWQLCVVLIVTAHAVDFGSLKWSEGSHPSVRKSINGPVPEEFQANLHGTLEELEVKEHRQKRMVHGQDYQTPSSVPKYLVRIVRKNRGSDTKLTWCTGSIIAPGFVQTAAWCVFDEPDQKWRKSVIPFSELDIIAGDFNMQQDESSEQHRQPIQYHIHPRYKYSRFKSNLEFDFAIIQLNTNFTYDDSVGEIERWTGPMPVVNATTNFLWFKMSGFGEANTERSSIDTNAMWGSTEGNQFYPRYQYYAWRQEGQENCKSNWYWNRKDTDEKKYGYLLPGKDETKVCFFTGLLAEVPYSIGAGDWGSPVTWFNHTENKEYLMMYTPYEPLLRLGNTVKGELSYRWAAKVGYYENFTADALLKTATDYYSDLTATSIEQTETINLDPEDSYYIDMTDWLPTIKQGDMDYTTQMYVKEYTFFLTADDDSHFVNVEIDYKPDLQIETNTTIYVRNGTGGGEIIKHKDIGKEDVTMIVNGIGPEMTIEVILANYEWNIQNMNLSPINISVTYSTSVSQESNTGDSCDSNYLECEDKSYCVPPSAVCDLHYDCLDGRDESVWCLGTSCKSSEYRCSTGECIPSWKLCDGNDDCADKRMREDETLMCVEANFDDNFVNELKRMDSISKNGAQTFGARFAILIASILGSMLL